MLPFTTSGRIAALAVLAATVLSSVAAGEDADGKKEAPSNTRIHELISQLGSDDFATREAASAALLQGGPTIYDVLESALQGGDAEVRLRAKLIQQQLVENAVTHLKQRGASLTGPRLAPISLAATRRKLTNDDLARIGCLRSLAYLFLDHNPITDKGLEYLGRLKLLENLSLVGCSQVTDSGIRNLQGLQHLRDLLLHGCNLSDATIAVVSTCPKLERVYLSGPKISDQGLSRLSTLKNLSSIGLYDCRITGAGIANLKPLGKRLRRLRFYNVPLQDADLRPLTQFPSLETVYINYAPVTDAGVAYLKQIPKLQILALHGTKITDQAIAHLKEIPELKRVRLGKSPVTLQGLAQLRECPALELLMVPSIDYTNWQIKELERQLQRGDGGPAIGIIRY